MKDYVVVTDSCCDLPLEYIERKNIPFVSLTCNLIGKEYKDDFGKSMNYKTFYEAMSKGEVPKTSQPSSAAFYKVFEDVAKEGKDIIYIGVSSGLSGTCNSARIAKDMILEENNKINIEIVDILTASLGQGILVMNAVAMKENGATINEVVDYLESIKLKLNTYITVDDLNHLKRGGRISSAAAFFGVVLHIKPVISINNEGKVIPVLKVKGRKGAVSKVADFVTEKIDNPEDQIIAISHGDCEQEALKLKELILSKIKVKDVVINFIGPVVGTYGGPGALAVFFVGKHRQNHVIE